MTARIGRAILELSTDQASFSAGLAQAEQQLGVLNRQAGAAAEGAAAFGRGLEGAGRQLPAMNAGLDDLNKSVPLSRLEMSQLASVLAGTSAFLSIAARGNKEMQAALQQATVALSLGSVALRVYKDQAVLTTAVTKALTVSTTALTAALGIGLGPLALIVVGLGVATVATAKWGAEVREAAEATGDASKELARQERHYLALAAAANAASQAEQDRQAHLDLAARGAARLAAEHAARIAELRRVRSEESANAEAEADAIAKAAAQAAAANKELIESLEDIDQQESFAERGRTRLDEAKAIEALGDAWASEAQSIVAGAKQVADAVGPEIASAMLDRAIPAFEALGDVGNKGIAVLLEALAELGASIPDNLIEPNQEAAKRVKSIWENATESIDDVFAQSFSAIATGAESLTEALAKIINAFLSSLFTQIGTQLFTVLFPGLAPAKKQHGGPLMAFQPAIVGEAGPELFVPRTSGEVIPHDELVGGGGLQVFVDARGAQRGVGADVRRAIAEMGEKSVRASVAKVQDEHLRGGAFRGRFRR